MGKKQGQQLCFAQTLLAHAANDSRMEDAWPGFNTGILNLLRKVGAGAGGAWVFFARLALRLDIDDESVGCDEVMPLLLAAAAVVPSLSTL